jgi:hypothetical protein
LKIVASQDLAKLGSKEAKAVVYNWKWYHNAPALVLWVILAGVIVLVKDNRNWRALLIFIPLLIVHLLWSMFLRMMPIASSGLPMFDQIFASLTIGIAVVWLLAHKLAKSNRFITFILALVTMTVVCFAGVISYSGFEFSNNTFGVAVFLAVLVLTMLLAIVLSGWRCRKRYSHLRFMLWLAVWSVAVCLAIMSVYACIAAFALSAANFPVPRYYYLIILFGPSLAMSAFLYSILFPYMILAMRSAFFRERFFSCFRLAGMTEATATSAETGAAG